MHAAAARVCSGESSEFFPACLQGLLPVDCPSVASQHGAVFSSHRWVQPPIDFLVAAYESNSRSTGDWCLPTLQPPPLHLNYSSPTRIITKRTSCASKATLRCRIAPQISPCTLAFDPCDPQFLTPTIDTYLHDWTWFQVSNFDLVAGYFSPDSSRRFFLPIGLRRKNSLRLDFTSSLNGRCWTPNPTDLWTYQDPTLSLTSLRLCLRLSRHMSNDTVAPSALS
jgi:hypothetical protein